MNKQSTRSRLGRNRPLTIELKQASSNEFEDLHQKILKQMKWKMWSAIIVVLTASILIGTWQLVQQFESAKGKIAEAQNAISEQIKQVGKAAREVQDRVTNLHRDINNANSFLMLLEPKIKETNKRYQEAIKRLEKSESLLQSAGKNAETATLVLTKAAGELESEKQSFRDQKLKLADFAGKISTQLASLPDLRRKHEASRLGFERARAKLMKDIAALEQDLSRAKHVREDLARSVEAIAKKKKTINSELNHIVKVKQSVSKIESQALLSLYKIKQAESRVPEWDPTNPMHVIKFDNQWQPDAFVPHTHWLKVDGQPSPPPTDPSSIKQPQAPPPKQQK